MDKIESNDRRALAAQGPAFAATSEVRKHHFKKHGNLTAALCMQSHPNGPSFHWCEAARQKDTFQKYVDSVLAKSAKIRSLIGDLQRNYPSDDTAAKPLS